MLKFNRSSVLPFVNAEHRFIEVLVPDFKLDKSRTGYRLDVRFDNKNLAVWSDMGKREVRRRIPGFAKKAKKYQKELDDVLVRAELPHYRFNDEEFPFRYASGGTLPIVRRGGKEYYCFFYRDVYPIGWNIANGGCDSFYELMNPVETIARELREELIAFDIRRRKWLLFEAMEGEVVDRPEFAAARKLICKQFPNLKLEKFRTTEIPLKWLDAPDEVHVQFGDSMSSELRGCFLNINAEDFGIEIDRIARLVVNPDTRFFDGESWGGIVVNSPVGLFDVDRLNNLVAIGCRHFLPDLFFCNAEHYADGPGMIKKAVQQYVKRMSKKRPYPVMKRYNAAPLKFDLCPVTRRIVQRYIATLIKIKPDSFDIFISFASEDKRIAQRVYGYLVRNTGLRVFFSAATLHDGNWSRKIDQALESARLFVLVGTSVENIWKLNIEFEWRAFDLLIKSHPKIQRKLVPVMIGIDPVTMPLLLRLYHGHFLNNQRQLKSCLPKLLQLCDRLFGGAKKEQRKV